MNQARLLFSLTNMISVGCFLVLAIIALRRGPRTKYLKRWTLFCIMAAGYAFSVLMANHVSTPAAGMVAIRFSLTFACLGLFTFFDFALIFIGLLRRLWPLVLLSHIWLVANLVLFWTTDLILAGVETSEFSRYAPRVGPLAPLYMAYIIFNWMIPLGLFIHSYRRSSGLKRTQTAYILVAFVLGFVGSAGSMLPSLLGSQTLMAFLPALLFPLFPLTITYAIVRHRLWDVQTIVHKTAVWVTLTIGLLIPLYLVFSLAEEMLPNYLSPSDRAVVVLVFFLLGYGYLGLLKPRLDHLFQRRTLDQQRYLDSFTRKMSGLEHPDEVARTAAAILDDTLYPQWAEVLYRRDEQSGWQPISSGELPDRGERGEIDPSNPFLTALTLKGSAVDESEVEVDLRLSQFKEEAGRFFQQTGARVCLPLVHGGTLLGLALLGSKRNLQPYTRADLEFLDRLGASCSTALSNGLLFEQVDLQRRDLQALSSTLEQRVQERTHELEAVNTKLGKANEELKQLDQLKSRFFANISHELRTPLTLIMAPLEGMLLGEMGPLSEDLQHQFKLIRRNAMRLLKLINNLLDLARLEDGRMRLDPELVDLVGFTAQLVEAAQPLAKRREIDMIFDHAGKPVVMADTEKLERAIINLLSNAMKFTEPGGYVVVMVGKGSASAWVSVQDSGIGVPAEELEHIFDRFRQVDASTTRRYGGTGIGLSLVKELVELHDGKISVSSEPDKGSTFTVNIPRLTDDEADKVVDQAKMDSNEVFSASSGRAGSSDAFSRMIRGQIDFRHQEILDTTTGVDLPAPGAGLVAAAGKDVEVVGARRERDGEQAFELRLGTPSHELPAVDSDGAARSTLLVVEDNRDMARVLADSLARRFRVLTASNGEEGLELARLELPALVLCDLMMPVMDGLTLCQKLRQDRTTSAIPVIMITARTGTEDSVAALEAGADDFISKPFSMRELHARIGAQLRIRQLDQAVARAERMATLGTTAAGLAHEVRNALNPIVGGLEVLDKVEDELEREELKQHMGAAAQRILDTIEAMQAFVRMGDAQLTSLDLDQAVQDSLKLLAHRLQGFTVECDLSLDQPVECFSGTLHQVLMNLLVNAVDAAGEDGSIWIATRRSGENALFSVRDSGPGIPAAERARIFFPYYTTKPVGHGTGMGLSISRSIVERHGGTIAVTSPPNQGAEITVEIPLKLKE